MPELKSSNLSSADYDPQKRRMTIRFQNGSVYRFDNIPEFHYNNLLKAKSPGRYFHSRINGTFQGDRLS